MNTATAPALHVASSREHGLWAAAVLVGGLVLPGLGVVLALGLVFTRLKDSPTATRVGLVALGLGLLVLQVVGMLTWGGPTTVVSPISPTT